MASAQGASYSAPPPAPTPGGGEAQQQEEGAADRDPLINAPPEPVGEPGLDVPADSIVLVIFAVFVDIASNVIMGPVMPYYAKEFGAGGFKVGLLFSAFSGASTLFVPWMGALADRTGRKRVLVISLLGNALMCLGQAFGWMYGYKYWVLFAFRIGSGAFAAVGSVAQVYVADVCRGREQLALWQARLTMAIPLALTVGPMTGGGLSKLGLNIPFYAASGLLALTAAVVAVRLRETPVFLRMRRDRGSAGGGAAAKALRDRPAPCTSNIALCSGNALFWGIGVGLQVSMTSLWAEARWDMDALRVGFMISTGAFLSVLFQALWGRQLFRAVARRLRCPLPQAMQAVAVAAATVWGAGQVGMTAVPNSRAAYVWGAVACNVAPRVPQLLHNAARPTLLSAMTEPATRGRVFGRVQMAANLGQFAGPLLGGQLAEMGGTMRRDWGDQSNLGREGLWWLWVVGGGSWVAAAVCIGMVRTAPRPAPPPAGEGATPTVTPKAASLMARVSTRVAEDAGAAGWADEHGTEGDALRLGLWAADLLRRRHYKWVSDPEGVREVLARAVPDLAVAPTHDEMLQSISDMFEGRLGSDLAPTA